MTRMGLLMCLEEGIRLQGVGIHMTQ